MFAGRILLCVALFLAGNGLMAQLPLGYAYSRPIVISNSNASSIADIQLEFDLATDALVTAGKMQADGDDIAFMYHCEELFYWIEDSSFNTTRTTCWVKIPLLPPGIDTVYMYYGDPAATANPHRNGDSTFVFFDDFNTGALPNAAKWSLVSNNGGDVHPQNPSGHYTPSAPNYSNAAIGLAHTMSAGNYEVGAKLFLAVNNVLIDFDPDIGWFQPTVLNVNRVATWYNDDEFPRDYTIGTAGSSVYAVSNQPIRGRWSYPRIRTIGNQVSTRRFSYIPTFFNEIGPTVNYNPAAAATLFIGSTAYQGIASKFDFIFVRNAVANEPVLQLQPEAANPWLAFSTYTVTSPGLICGNDTLQLHATPIAGATYAWTGPGNYMGTQPQDTLLHAAAGMYTATAALHGACIADSVWVQPASFPPLGNDTLFCTSQPFILGGPAFPGASYQWTSTSGFTSTESDPVDSALVTTTYFLVQVSADSTCISYDTITVTIGPQPVAAFIMNSDASGVQFTNQSQNADYYNWIFGDGHYSSDADPVHDYNTDGTYSVGLIATAQNGCADTVWQDVNVDVEGSIYIPNAFTPNGDGNNDVFQISSYNIASMEVIIFDRWGQQIAKWSGPAGSWDGKMNGHLCQIDVYVYKVAAVDIRGYEYSYIGHVSLIR